MKNKILCIIMLGILIIAAQPMLSAAEVKKARVINENGVTISIHAFYDVDGDNEQDPDEGDAENFYVFANGFAGPYDWSRHLVGRTDGNGNLTFEWQEDGVGDDVIFIHVRDKWAWIAPDQYKGDLSKGPSGTPYEDGSVFIIPCKSVASESHSKPIIQNLFGLFFDRFPLLQQLLNL